MPKYHRRLVARNTLTDLESAITTLEEEGWELDPTVPEQSSGTLLGVLRAIRKPGMKVNIPVPMRQLIPDEPAVKLVEDMPVNG
jgi:hypothetical protein